MSTALRILDEDRIELEEVCELLKCSMTTVYRACRRGLEHLHTGPRRGGKIITSRQAVERYLAKLNGIDLDRPADVEQAPAHTKLQQRELDRVDRELAAAGL
jgi:predicted site-specific integrase-resolvase